MALDGQIDAQPHVFDEASSRDGRIADFHSLRHTFITNLVRGGVQPKVAQQLARHSTITLTLDRYSHVLAHEQADALLSLPDLADSPTPQIRATGTDNG